MENCKAILSEPGACICGPSAGTARARREAVGTYDEPNPEGEGEPMTWVGHEVPSVALPEAKHASPCTASQAACGAGEQMTWVGHKVPGAAFGVGEVMAPGRFVVTGVRDNRRGIAGMRHLLIEGSE